MISTLVYLLYPTPFLGPVAYIVCLGTQEKMVRIHAWWIVTTVQNERTAGDFAMIQTPCHAMSTFSFPIYAHASISVSSPYRPAPYPATICFREFVLESL